MNKSIANTLLLVLSSLFILCCSGCGPDDNCKDKCEQGCPNWCDGVTYPNQIGCCNYDPCLGRKFPVDAKFGLKTSYKDGNGQVPDLYFNLYDTVLVNTPIKFTVNDKRSSLHLWRVSGTTRTWQDTSFTLGFPSNLAGRSLEVSLAVSRLRDTICAGGLDAVRDTFTKTLYFVHEDSAATYGTFRGYDTDNPGVIYNVSIRLKYPYHPVLPNAVILTNLMDCGCEMEQLGSWYNEYRSLYVGGFKLASESICSKPLPSGVVDLQFGEFTIPEIDNKGRVTIKYEGIEALTGHTPNNPGYRRFSKIFIGQKTN